MRKTYWHLGTTGRYPSEYEIVTSKLLYSREKEFSVKTSTVDWYEKYFLDSELQTTNWEKFKDPDQLTYAAYNKKHKESLDFVNGLYAMRRIAPDVLPKTWLLQCITFFSPLRFPMHGLQMGASYLGHLAPTSELMVAFLFQVADEIKSIQILTYFIRFRAHALTDNVETENSRYLWEKNPNWQPLRRVSEELLVTYDWAQAWVAQNLVVKPLFDFIFKKSAATYAGLNNDYLLRDILLTLWVDSEWSRRWNQALVKIIGEDNSKNSQMIKDWSDKWFEKVLPAFDFFCKEMNIEIPNSFLNHSP